MHLSNSLLNLLQLTDYNFFSMRNSSFILPPTVQFSLQQCKTDIRRACMFAENNRLILSGKSVVQNLKIASTQFSMPTLLRSFSGKIWEAWQYSLIDNIQLVARSNLSHKYRLIPGGISCELSFWVTAWIKSVLPILSFTLCWPYWDESVKKAQASIPVPDKRLGRRSSIYRKN